MNFFEIASAHLKSLTDNERKLFDYIVKNMNDVKGMSIREVSAKCFVSTATFLRFVRKIGFSGYSELITVLKFTTRDAVMTQTAHPETQFVVPQKNYREEYLKNIEETVHVLRPELLHQITAKMNTMHTLFIFATGISKGAAHYIADQYRLAGFNVVFPSDRLYRKAAIGHIEPEDLVLIIDYSGEEPEFISLIQQLTDHRPLHPMIMSITGADNNAIQNLSDANLYTFVDEVTGPQGATITSRVSAVVLMELVLYQWLEDQGI
ncbi:MurR/RpiR family transcriptional regulator [Furfurilactobacillus sp. WILCCON 0119]|uniref:MurR/RpiR family transcriptional regulator n=1 Tax=Furfurilactobacillus entadae TaxID=2922307 RepID=UPI0035E57069